MVMRLSTKHANQQSVMLQDFTGGLNVSCTENLIADNELSEVVNMEIDSNSKLLRTVQGTDTLYTTNEYTFKSAAFDILNSALILFTEDNKILATKDFYEVKEVGTLTGTGEVITAMWEDGILIASGGKLQYAKGTEPVETIDTSPEHCNGVYIRSGRVLVFDNTDQVLFSGVGDETNWTQNTNDPSASLFAQIGYKVGGHIIGMVNMSKDILFIKSNGMVFRLENEYPDWRISELGRNIFCKGTASYCNIINNVLIMSDISLQSIQTTQEYGDMKPTNIGSKVASKIANLPSNTKLRYVPPLNQVWCIGENGYVLVLDCNTSAFFQRKFNSVIVDVLSINNDVYVIKEKTVCKLNADSFYDDNEPLRFKVQMKTHMANYEYLVKRITLCVTLFKYEHSYNSHFLVGNICMPLPRMYSSYLFDNTRPIVDNYEPIEHLRDIYVDTSDKLEDSYESLYELEYDKKDIQTLETLRRTRRVVYRTPEVRISGAGIGEPFILNYIQADVVEV
mgnify:FL=1|jgi:hypothetical protein|nr:MAG: stabilization protein [Bacteriophage sp.]